MSEIDWKAEERALKPRVAEERAISVRRDILGNGCWPSGLALTAKEFARLDRELTALLAAKSRPAPAPTE